MIAVKDMRKEGCIMRRVCVLIFVQLLVFGTACYGAVSEDMSVYVRKDVFEVYMQGVNSKLDMLIEQMKEFREELKAQRKEFQEELKAQRKEFQEEFKAQRQDISELTRAVSVLSTRIDGLDARMGDLRNDIYLGLGVLGIIFGLPAVQKMFEKRAEKKSAAQPSLTIEDVMRLIEEHDAKLSGKTLQGL